MDNLFLVALQSSLILGFVHGINPCGHSWLVLAPFVSGEKNGKRASMLTLSFILGTALACLAIGLTLGIVSASFSPTVRFWADIVANGVIIILGIILIIKPHLLHSHEHDDHQCSSNHEHCHGHSHEHRTENKLSRFSQVTIMGLFSIGFVNMVIPCPTAAIMYSYAIESGNAFRSTMVFAMYALSTGIALGAVIYAIYKISSFARKLNQHWLENAIMRGIGVLTIIFGTYSLLTDTIYKSI